MTTFPRHFPSLLFVVTMSHTAAMASTPNLEGSLVTITGYCCSAPIPATAFTVPASAVVGPSVEFPSGSLQTTNRTLISSQVDVSGLAIDIRYSETATAAIAPFNGYGFRFEGLPHNHVITGASLDPASTFLPEQVGLSFTHHNVFYNGSGLSFTPSSRVLINLTLAPVPEPAMATMLAAGGLLMWGVGRVSRRRTT